MNFECNKTMYKCERSINEKSSIRNFLYILTYIFIQRAIKHSIKVVNTFNFNMVHFSSRIKNLEYKK